jgi:hypothetical protein
MPYTNPGARELPRTGLRLPGARLTFLALGWEATWLG